MATRTPKLDTEWMTALGFTLVDRPHLADLHWRNEELDLQVRDDNPPKQVALRYNHALQLSITRAGQRMLREVLLPAMGLELKSEYDNDGYTTRTYVSEG